MHCQWERNPKIAPSPWDCISPPEEDRATAIGNMHKNLIKISHVVREICSRTDIQTDRHTQTCSLQYLTTTPAGEETRKTLGCCWVITILIQLTTITACTVVQALVKANSPSHRKGQIFTICGPQTIEQMLIKHRIYNFVAGVSTCANPCWPQTRNLPQFGFLVDLCIQFFGSCPAIVDRFWQSMCQMTCFHASGCFFGW